jgi:hypothetical protein
MAAEMLEVRRRTLESEVKLGYNDSTVFVLPMLGKSWFWFGKYVINAYIGDAEKPQYKEHIFLHLRFEDSENFRRMEGLLREHPNFIEDYDPDIESVMFIFTVPDEHIKDLELFKKGKYSELSVKLKNAIVGRQTWGTNFEILTRSPKLRAQIEERIGAELPEGAELYHIPEPENEIFRYKQ